MASRHTPPSDLDPPPPAAALCVLPPRAPPQASQIALWVVRSRAGGLAPYTLRAHRPPPAEMPGEEVERVMAT